MLISKYAPWSPNQYPLRKIVLFAIAAPKLWNSLPIIIRQSPSLESFKASLKYFFLFTGNSNFIGAVFNYL